MKYGIKDHPGLIMDVASWGIEFYISPDEVDEYVSFDTVTSTLDQTWDVFNSLNDGYHMNSYSRDLITEVDSIESYICIQNRDEDEWGDSDDSSEFNDLLNRVLNKYRGLKDSEIICDHEPLLISTEIIKGSINRVKRSTRDKIVKCIFSKFTEDIKQCPAFGKNIHLSNDYFLEIRDDGQIDFHWDPREAIRYSNPISKSDLKKIIYDIFS